MRRLSKKQIIRFCDETIAKINNAEICFLCNTLIHYIRTKTFWGNLFGVNKDLSKYIPEFTYENASKYCNAKLRNNKTYVSDYDKTWWSSLDTPDYKYNSKDRILFLEWIKSHYTTPVK